MAAFFNQHYSCIRCLTRPLFIYALLFLSITNAHATEETYYGGLLRSEIITGAYFEVSDTFPTGVTDLGVQDVIWFSIDEEYKVKVSAFTATLSVSIEKYDVNNALIGVAETKTFTVNYSPTEGVSYPSGQLYKFTGAYRLKITIVSPGVGLIPNTLTTLLDAFRIEAKINVRRKYPFDCTATPPTVKDYAVDNNSNELVAGWSKQSGAEEYDVEWTFIDTLGAVKINTNGSATLFNNLFKNNATRITTTQSYYKIPLVYPAGRVYLRVRAVAYDAAGLRIVGKWSSEATGYLPNTKKDIFVIKDAAWHEKKINWQTQLVFAEEGKKSQSVSYYDGTLHSRQQVAKSDATATIVASETLYDKQGRPAIQMMPVPVSDYTINSPSLPANPWLGKLRYTRGFVAVNGSTPYYNSDQYDSPAFGCNQTLNPAAAMDSSASISGHYYSGLNPWKNKLFHNNIPSALGNPYAMTEYTADGTGRIRRQGSVGQIFQLGSGNETKYFYSKPDQIELDQMFGIEAGYAAHYQKNMAIDPNGQISVSYLDAHGRTIATALAGAKPTSYDKLPNFSNPSILVKDILNNVRQDAALVSTYSLMVTNAGNDTIRYSLDSKLELSLGTGDCLAANRCYDCLYDVEFSIKDICGNSLGGSPFAWRNYTYNQYQTACNTLPDTIMRRIVLTNIQPGEYQITKTLRISQDAMQAYASDYVSNLTCLPTQASLIATFLGDTLCAPDCSTCRSRVGTLPTFITRYFQGFSGIPSKSDTVVVKKLYADAMRQCNELCDQSTPGLCSVMYEQMLQDVTPGGQYAAYVTTVMANDAVFSGTITDKTSIFYLKAGQTLYPYQNPALVYYNNYGQPDTISFSEAGGRKTPNELTVNQFVQFFKPSWTKNLVQLHPEYCQYLCCKKINDTKTDSLLNSFTNFSQAAAAGYWPLTALIAKDSFFIQNPGETSSISNYFNQYTRTDTSLCGTPISLFEVLSSSIFCNGQLPCTIGGCSSDSALLWQVMAGQYLSYKTWLKSQKIRSGSCSLTGPTFNPCPPPDYCFGKAICGANNPNPYQNKTSRVPYYPPPIQKNAQDQLQALLDSARTLIKTNCDTVCAGNADSWIYQLSQTCDMVKNANASQLSLLRTRLINQCKAGCDQSHPFGAVSGAPGSPYTDIEAVLESVFGAINLCTQPECRGELIDFPGTYTQKQYITPTVTIANAPDCDYCAQKNTVYNCWLMVDPNAVAGNMTAFTNYVNTLSDVTVSVSDVTNLCPPSGCKTLATTVTVHPVFECGVCRNFTDVNAVWVAVKNLCTAPLSENQKKLIAQKANLQLGLNRSYDDYNNFINQNTGLAKPECRFFCLYARTKSAATIAEPCVSQQTRDAATLLADLTLQNLRDSMRREFVRKYLSKCLGSQLLETCKISCPQGEYQYMLYYYDQAGNLIKTVPPKGVSLITNTATLATIKQHRTAGTTAPADFPVHSFITRYWYNTLGQMIRDSMPDHVGKGDYYWYDRLGRVILSQNSKQRPLNDLSYNVYDALGRMIEVGKVHLLAAPGFNETYIWNQNNPNEFKTWLAANTNKTEVTRTYYDAAIAGLSIPCTQDNLRNRIASITYEAVRDNSDLTFDAATHYSYDIGGNVKCLVQDIPELNAVGNRYKRIDYDYDLVSGKVNYVYFQKDLIDQMIHHYVYDADNRLQYVETSRNGLLWNRDANYEYYLHGPLARTELGQYRVQGLDFAYTLQGWLKGVNAAALNLASTNVADFSTRDMGLDGKSGNTGDWARNKTVARDAIAFTLGYHYKDFYRVGKTGAVPDFDMGFTSLSYFNSAGPQLYNGNIRNSVYTVSKLNGANSTNYGSPESFHYRYDQLNRITNLKRLANYDLATYSWLTATTSDTLRFYEKWSFDPNGNILTAKRCDDAGTILDDLAYQFGASQKDNKLPYITDAAGVTANTQDLETQSAANYGYDNVGNLTKDVAAGYNTGAITWTNSEKLAGMTKTGTLLAFRYDAMQNRIVKAVRNTTTNTEDRTYYIRDAQGNIMAVYSANLSNASSATPTWNYLKTNEFHLYGSTRVGLLQEAVTVSGSPTNPNNPAAAATIDLPLGLKRYELNNHLGNVLAVVSDRKRPKSTAGTDGSTVQWFEPDVLSSQQYYAFGMLMPNRQYSASGYDYRFGFNGKEGDDEVKGDDNQQDYGMRIYDPRVGRFLSVDPIRRKYPWYTPYQFAGNKPIWAVDLDGLEEVYIQNFYDNNQSYQRTVVQGIKDRRGNFMNLNAVSTDQQGNKVYYKNNFAIVVNIGNLPNGTNPIETRLDKKDLSNFEKRVLEDSPVSGKSEKDVGDGIRIGTEKRVRNLVISFKSFNNIDEKDRYEYERRSGGVQNEPVYGQEQYINDRKTMVFYNDFINPTGRALVSYNKQIRKSLDVLNNTPRSAIRISGPDALINQVANDLINAGVSLNKIRNDLPVGTSAIEQGVQIGEISTRRAIIGFNARFKLKI